MTDNFFAQLQALSMLNKESTVDTTRQQLNKIVDFFKHRRTYEEEVIQFATLVRHLEPKTLFDCDSFMVQPDVLINEIPVELQHDALGFCKGMDIVFSGRYVYPVKDIHGDVMGFCGYDKFSDTKYLDSINHGYKAKQYSFWGMEKLPEYYKSKDPVFFPEGIVCAIYLRQCGMQACALLGSSISPYVQEIIRRFGQRAIIVNDSDEAGNKCRAFCKKHLPLTRCVQSTLAKDIDDSRQVNEDFASELLKLRDPFYRSPMFV